MRIGRNLRIVIKETPDFDKIFASCKELDIDFFQIFFHYEATSYISEKDLDDFGKKLKLMDLKMVVHSRFNINMCHKKKSSRFQYSVYNLIDDLRKVYFINKNSDSCIGVVIHLGRKPNNVSTIDEAQNNFIDGIVTALRFFNDENAPQIILENGVGLENELSSDIDNLSKISESIHPYNLKFCIDTCHLWANDTNLNSKSVVKKYVKKFDRQIGLENMILIHFNSAMGDCGSKLDRHDSIGSGKIKAKSLFYFIKCCQLYTKNFYILLETPDWGDRDLFEELSFVKSELEIKN